jgi:hypothetical protein
LHELNFFLLQPAEEVRKEREVEKVKEIQGDKSEGEVAKRETKEVQTNELRAEKASLKATKKTKTMQCKVILLDGTEYTCDLEVSPGAECRAVLLCGMEIASPLFVAWPSEYVFLFYQVPMCQFVASLHLNSSMEEGHHLHFTQYFLTLRISLEDVLPVSTHSPWFCALMYACSEWALNILTITSGC